MNYLKKELYQLVADDPRIFEFIQESSLDGMWYWDLDNPEEEWMNAKFWTTLGYDPAEMPHKANAWQGIIDPEDLELAIENAQRHFNEPDYPYDQVVRYKHKLGHTVWIRCRGIAIRDENGIPKRMLGAHIEVTDLKEKEEELRKIVEITREQNDKLQNFTHIVSHNLRAHSGNFEMLLQMAAQEIPGIEENELFQHLKTTSENLMETITHLNEVILPGTRLKDSLNSIKLYESVAKTIINLSFLANDTKVSLINEIDADIEVMGIQSYIDSIIYNLISNGIKYHARDKESFVRISSALINDSVHINFEDNGLGMDLYKMGDELFGMYKTFHGNKDAKGIGLFISKNQIEAMGGSIKVRSKPGQGSTFTVILPYQPVKVAVVS